MSKKYIITLYFGITLLSLLLLIWSTSQGPSGSDQYWYITDSQAIADGQAPHSNMVYPGPYLRKEILISDNHASHNSPMIYLAGWLGRICSTFVAWLTLNFVFSVLSAAMLAILAVRLTQKKTAGVIIYAAYFFLPLIFWQQANILQESFFAMLSTGLLFIYMFAENKISRWVLLMGAAFVASACNPFFMPILLIIPLYFCWHFRKKINAFYIAISIAFIILALLAGSIRWSLFPVTFPQGLMKIFANTLPGETNMEWYVRISAPTFSVSLLWGKLFNAIYSQIQLSKISIFYWPVNLMVILSGIYAYRNRDLVSKKLLVANVIFLGLYAVLVTVHQNQYRYMMLILPGFLLSASGFVFKSQFFENKRNTCLGLLVGVLCACVFVDIALGHRIRKTAVEEAKILKTVKNEIDKLPQGDFLINMSGKFLDGKFASANQGGAFVPLSYILKPRKALILDPAPDKISNLQIRQYLSELKPRYLLVTPDSKIKNRLNEIYVKPLKYKGKMVGLELYELSLGKISTPELK